MLPADEILFGYSSDIKNNSDLVKELDEASIGNLLPLGQIKQLEQTYLTHEMVRILLIFSSIAFQVSYVHVRIGAMCHICSSVVDSTCHFSQWLSSPHISPI